MPSINQSLDKVGARYIVFCGCGCRAIHSYHDTSNGSHAQFAIDTDVDGSVITGDDQGVLTFDISQLVTETGFYSAKLVIFDPTNTDGLVIISPCGGNYPKLSVNVCGN